MVGRAWRGLLTYFGFADGPESIRRDAFGWGGVMSGGTAGMGVAASIDASWSAAIALLVAGSLAGWIIVRGGRKVLGRR